MITMIRCNYHYSDAADKRAKQLLQEFPEFVLPTGTIFFDEPIEGVSIKRFLGRIGELGLKLWTDKSRSRDQSVEIPCSIYRVYDRNDLSSSTLLELLVPYRDDILGGFFPDAPHFRVTSTKLPNKRVILGGLNRPCCPERVKALLEPTGMAALTFELGYREPWITGVGRSAPGWPDGEEKWWALGSDVIMPPVGPPLLKFDYTFENRVDRFYAGVSNFKEDGFDDCELHYPQAEVDALGEFDAALMYEGRPDASLIVSRRFWETCVTNEIECDFKPVRIDEE